MAKIQRENKMFVFDKPLNRNYKYYIMRFLLPFYDIFYRIILAMTRPKKRARKFQVSICGIFKDEAHNMSEWIEYHRIVGIEHFYLYNNFSTDNYMDILQSYVEQDIVTLIEWPIPMGQFPAYEHFYKEYREETQWVSFLDLDEFICPYYETSIVDWIKKFEKYPCVVVYWKMFGTSGLLDHDPKKLTTEQYIVSWEKLDNIGKVLLNTDYEIAYFNSGVHHATYTKVSFLGRIITIPPINEFKYFLRYNIQRTGLKKPTDFTIQINHYWSKAYKDYHKNKVERGDVNNHPRTLKIFLFHEHHNKATDHKIFRFLIQLKTTLSIKNEPNC